MDTLNDDGDAAFNADRVMKDVPPLSRRPLTREEIFIKVDGKEVPDVDRLRKHFKGEGKLEKAELVELVLSVSNILQAEPNLVHVKEPVVIVGDIHGQYYDLIHMFEKVVDKRGQLNTNMLFLGDYVDRGDYSLECVLYLYALKLRYPKQIYLLRGNHESRAMAETFTFRKEVLNKCNGDESLYELFMSSFDALPIVADVNSDYLCMHGGISPELSDVKDIDKIDRFLEPPL